MPPVVTLATTIAALAADTGHIARSHSSAIAYRERLASAFSFVRALI